MTETEENIAFEQYVKDHGGNFPFLPTNAMRYMFDTLPLENRREFLEEAKINGVANNG